MSSKLTKLDCRILIFLENSSKRFNNAQYISNKLEAEYSYVLKRLNRMASKYWVTKRMFDRQLFFELTSKAPMYTAKKILEK